MNRLAQNLATIVKADRLAEKWLVAPSYRTGKQWIETVVRNGTPAVNVRVKTVKGLALELAAPDLAREELELLSPLAGSVLTDRVLGRFQTGGEGSGKPGYLSRLLPGPSLARTLLRSLNDLRLAGIEPGKIGTAAFSDELKGRDLGDFLKAWLRQLESSGFVDYAGILQKALRRLEHDTGFFPEDALLLVPADLETAPLERDLLDAFPADRGRELAVDEPSFAGSSAVRIFHAEGEANEVREVLRRCLAEGIALDRVELLHTSPDTYIPLVFETFARLSGGLEDYELELPVTFAEGIPARYSRPGRALEAWISWIMDGYPQNRLVRMIRDGLLQIPSKNESAFSSLADCLRTVPVGKGRNRYPSMLDRRRDALEQQKKRLAARGDTVDPVERDDIEKGLSGIEVLRGIIAGLFPPEDAPDAAFLDCAQQFLEKNARSANRFDNLARQRLQSRIKRLKSILDGGDGTGRIDLRDWLAALPVETRVGGSGPRPGRLHVAPLLSGGHSGREHTFIVGLDDTRFPGAGLQDPVLLDRERRKLSNRLRTAAVRLRKQVDDFALLMGRLRGSVSLGFSCRDMEEDREVFPSPVALSAFRTSQDRSDATLADLAVSLGAPASFAPLDRDGALHRGEWWLWRLLGSLELEEPRSLVCRCFPFLAKGFAAEAERAGDLFTPYDGYVPQAGRSLDPFSPRGTVLSGSALETIGRCPLSYFFRYALGIKPLDEIEIDPSQWLDPLKAGTLLHDLFRRFMNSLIGDGSLPPSFDRDRERLLRILDRCVEEYKDLFPPHGESIFLKERHDLMKVAQIFLRMEEEFCRSSRPVFLEVAVGIPAEGPGTILDERSSMELEPVPGRTIRVRGRIDRIDRLVGGDGKTFGVWDYKTGSPRRFTEMKGAFGGGRVVQHGLYIAMAQELLHRKVDRKAVIREFGYAFPGLSARGRRITWTPERLSRWGEVAALLCRIVAAGCFLPAETAEPCRFCDFRSICGDREAGAEASRRKLENEANNVLRVINDVREHE